MAKRLILLVEITSPPPPFGSLTISGSLVQPSLGFATSQQLTATGGSGALTWQLLGNVPPGIEIDRLTGRVFGAWSARGSYNFYARVADAVGQFATRAFSWSIADAEPAECNDYPLSPFSPASDSMGDDVNVLPFDAVNGHLCNTITEG